MGTERINRYGAMLRYIVERRLWGNEPFYLLDVGASGGIESHWSAFRDLLRAVGFEPLISETERLNEAAAGTNVRYEAAFVTCRDFDRLFPPELRGDPIASRSNDPFARTSATRAQELLQMNYAEHVFNAGTPLAYADRTIILDEYVPRPEYGTVDFIKIDTDGHDIEVVLGTEDLLSAGGVLGFSIEAQFHGSTHPSANTFANIDRFMREHGFSLFDLDVYRYSRSALPQPFVYNIPAQTTSGQVLWGEAVYFRDLADSDYERKWQFEFRPDRILKLACLFELFGVRDCAAELLLARGGFLDATARGKLLDLLMPPDESGARQPYGEHIRAFERDPTTFYESARAGRAAAVQVENAPNEGTPEPSARDLYIESLRARLSELKARVSDVESQSRGKRR